jgi:ADP-ribose pyrophosphatase YjhB (NUDIX family)
MSAEETKKTRIRVAALVVRDGKILLAEHEKGGRRYWLLPGGGMEYGESVEETLKRELVEEAGLEIEVGDLLWVVDSIPDDGHRHVLNLILSAEAKTTELAPTPDRVLRDVKWKDIGELESLILFPDTRAEILEFIRNGQKGRALLGKRWKVSRGVAPGSVP